MKKNIILILMTLTASASFAQNTFPSSGNVTLGSTASPTQLGVTIPVVSAGNNYGSYFTDGVNSTLAIRSLGNGAMHLSTDAVGRSLLFGGGTFEQTLAVNPGGRVDIGSANLTGRLQVAGAHASGIIQDIFDRPSIAATGQYPQMIMMAGGSGDAGHGPTLMLGSYDAGTSGSHKHWSIGTSGQNSTFLDIGYHEGVDINPHAGIRNFDGNTFLTVLNTGNVGIGNLAPSEKLDVTGNIRCSGNIGIGLATPASEKLEVGGNIKSARFFNSTLSGVNSKNSFQSFNTSDVTVNWGWIAADFGGNGTEDKVVLGSGFNGKAVLGAHNYNLTSWTDLLISPGSGNIGIGITTSPQAKLDIAGQIRIVDGTQARNRVLTCDGNGLATWQDPQGGSGGTSQWLTSGQNISYNTGNVGIGTSSPQAKLDIASSTVPGTPDIIERYTWIPDASGWGLRLQQRHTGNSIVYDWIEKVGAGVEKSVLSFNNGNVLIGNVTGTGANSYLLNVAGNIRANDLVVNTDGADFVFEPSYKLKPLAEVEDFVKQNKHLPGIAPAAEMQKDGVGVGESQTKLLQKIEELTLYMIEIKKENENIKKQNEAIKEQNETLSKRIEKLESAKTIQP